MGAKDRSSSCGIIAVHDQHRRGDRLQLFSEIILGERDAVVGGTGATHRSLTSPVPDHGIGRLRAPAVVSAERSRRDGVVRRRSCLYRAWLTKSNRRRINHLLSFRPIVVNFEGTGVPSTPHLGGSPAMIPSRLADTVPLRSAINPFSEADDFIVGEVTYLEDPNRKPNRLQSSSRVRHAGALRPLC